MQKVTTAGKVFCSSQGWSRANTQSVMRYCCMAKHFFCSWEWRCSCGDDKVFCSSQCWSCANTDSAFRTTAWLTIFFVLCLWWHLWYGLLQPLCWRCMECVVHHERNVCEEQHHICVVRTSNNRVISSSELYWCLLPQCKALRTCRSGFPIATGPWVHKQYYCYYSNQLKSISITVTVQLHKVL